MDGAVCGAKAAVELAFTRSLGHFFVIVGLGAVTIVIVLTSSEPADGSTVALDRALRSALPEQTEVIVKTREDAGSTTDPSAWVAYVEWTDHERRAIVRTTERDHPTEREIRFADADAPAERGRTVGFALASMVPDTFFVRVSPPPPAPVPPPARVPVAESRDTTPTRPRAAPRFSVELLGQGAAGFGGTADGLGGVVGGRVNLGAGLHVRAAFGIRLGQAPAAQATSRLLAPSLGVGWRTTLSDTFQLGVRVDGLLLHQHVAHFSADDPEPVGRGRFLPGADARVEAIFRIAERTGVILAAGPELAFGTTRLFVAGQQTGQIPPVRLCGEVGFTVSF